MMISLYQINGKFFYDKVTPILFFEVEDVSLFYFSNIYY